MQYEIKRLASLYSNSLHFKYTGLKRDCGQIPLDLSCWRPVLGSVCNKFLTQTCLQPV